MSEMRKCSFCGRQEKDVEFMIPSPDGKANICDFCIELCQQVLEDYDLSTAPQDEEIKLDLTSLPTPMMMKEKLDDYVIGQDKAKITDTNINRVRFYDMSILINDILDNDMDAISPWI